MERSHFILPIIGLWSWFSSNKYIWYLTLLTNDTLMLQLIQIVIVMVMPGAPLLHWLLPGRQATDQVQVCSCSCSAIILVKGRGFSVSDPVWFLVRSGVCRDFLWLQIWSGENLLITHFAAVAASSGGVNRIHISSEILVQTPRVPPVPSAVLATSCTTSESELLLALIITIDSTCSICSICSIHTYSAFI